MSPGASVRVTESVAVVGIAAAVTGVPILMHFASPVAAVATTVVLAILLAGFAPAAVAASLVGAYLFQNSFVSLVSPAIAGPDDFNAIRAYNFLLTAVVWLVLAAVALARWGLLASLVRRLLLWTGLGLVLIGFYFALGLLSDPKSAVVYLRNIASPILLFQACLVAASRSGGGLHRSLVPIGVLALAYGYAELLLRGPLFNLLNADSYMAFAMREQIEGGVWLKELQETGRVFRGLEDAFTIDLFNTPLLAELNLQMVRLLGPNFHPISFAYAIALFGILFVATRRWLLAAATLPLIIVIGSKGALATVALPVIGLGLARLVSRRIALWAFAAALAGYAGAAMVVGLEYGDYHVIGLLGGLKGFLQNPFGHGLGAGGNLSTNMSAIDWSRAQQLGEADRAVESAVGALLFQMGLAGAVLCLIYVRVAAFAWSLAERRDGSLLTLTSLAVLTLTANGLLQEEALFAPLAMASFLGLLASRLADVAPSRLAAPAPREDRGPRARIGSRSVRPAPSHPASGVSVT